MEPVMQPVQNGNGRGKIVRAAYVIFFGLFTALTGVVWDIFYHYTSGVKEGLEEFFRVPAHDFSIIGFAIAWVGALMLFRALRS